MKNSTSSPKIKFKLSGCLHNTGIFGNEKADQLANLVMNQNIPEETTSTAEDSIREMRALIYAEWTKDLKVSSLKLLKSKVELGGAHGLQTRREEVVINRLRLGTSMLSHGNIFTKSNLQYAVPAQQELLNSIYSSNAQTSVMPVKRL